MSATEDDCSGEPLPSCDEGWTGRSCALSCDAGAPGCRVRYYCHADGRVAGLALSRAHLLEVESGLAPLELRDRLEGWIAGHEADLGLTGGRDVTCLVAFLLMLTARRRRERGRALGGALVAALGTTACFDAHTASNEADVESTSSSASSTDADPSGESDGVPLGWPERWYGDYYEEPGVSLGQDLQGTYLGDFGNMRVRDGLVTIERFGYELGDQPGQWSFSTELDGDALRLHPPGGRWDALYPGADEVSLRAGADCGEIVLEVRGALVPGEDVAQEHWLRGALCVVDPWDDTVCCDRWMIDLCPDTPTTCSEG